MTHIWPPYGNGIEDAPAHPFYQEVRVGLEPLWPLLRQVKYGPSDFPSVTLALGPDDLDDRPMLVGLCADGEVLTVDLPVGDVPQTTTALVALLEANFHRTWPLRVDAISPTPQGNRAVVVMEHRTSTAELPDLSRLVLAGWREALLIRSFLFQFVHEEG